MMDNKRIVEEIEVEVDKLPIDKQSTIRDLAYCSYLLNRKSIPKESAYTKWNNWEEFIKTIAGAILITNDPSVDTIEGLLERNVKLLKKNHHIDLKQWYLDITDNAQSNLLTGEVMDRSKEISRLSLAGHYNQVWCENMHHVRYCEQFFFKFNYNTNIIAAIKALNGYHIWHPEEKIWEVGKPGTQHSPDLHREVKDFVMQHNFVCHQDLTYEWYGNADSIAASLQATADFVVDGITKEMYGYQKAGVKYASEKKRVLIADEMGLGKSLEAIGTCVNLDSFPVLVICPKTIMYNWKNEWAKFTNIKAALWTENSTHANVVIVNYENAKKMLKAKDYFKAIIVDESHFVKSKATQRYKVISELAHSKDVRLLLTGTPIVNYPDELIPQLKILGYLKDDSEKKFRNRYCAKTKKYGPPASNLEELNVKLRSMCFPYNYLVSLPNGKHKAIGELVESRYTGDVLCYDQLSSKVTSRRVVAYSKSETPCRMVRIKHKFGELCCTPDHPIYSKGKYIRAEDINIGMPLSILQNTVSRNSTWRPNIGKVLFTKMYGKIQRKIFGNTRIAFSNVEEQTDRKRFAIREDLSRMLKIISETIRNVGLRNILGKPNLLFCNLSWERGVQERKTKKSKSAQEGLQESNVRKNQGKTKKNTIFSKTSTKTIRTRFESLEEKSKNSRNAYRMENKQRSNSSFISAFFLLFRTSNTNKQGFWTIQKGSYLQSLGRHSNSVKNDSYRNRRKTPLFTKTKSLGYKENRNLIESWVESVEIFERGSEQFTIAMRGQDKYIYDIEVEDNHNFFCENILVHNCLIRRMKSDVYTELPDKVRTIMDCDITTRSEYDEVERDLINYLSDKRNFSDAKLARIAQVEALVKVNYLRQISAEGCFEDTRDFVQNTIEQGNKVVVFAHHKKLLRKFAEHFNCHDMMITGEVNDPLVRQKIVDRFQTDPEKKIILLGIRAASIGITLTAASTVVFAEPDWTPAAHDQGEDRCHRIGQKDTVNAYYFIGKDTIAQNIMGIIERKRNIAHQSFGTESTTEQNASVYADMMKERFGIDVYSLKPEEEKKEETALETITTLLEKGIGGLAE